MQASLERLAIRAGGKPSGIDFILRNVTYLILLVWSEPFLFNPVSSFFDTIRVSIMKSSHFFYIIKLWVFDSNFCFQHDLGL